MPTIVIKANEFHVDSKTPCRLVFVIPLELPSLLDSSIPPPPYYPPDNNITQWSLCDSTMTALRPVVVGALYTVLGPDAAISDIVPAENDDWINKDPHVSRLVNDRSKFDPESGDWTDQYGNMGSGAQAYLEYLDQVAIIEAYKIRVDQGIIDNKINVLVVELKAMPVLHDGKVAFVARKYEDAEQEHYNHCIWQEEW
jgi:hypothetical protein